MKFDMDFLNKKLDLMSKEEVVPRENYCNHEWEDQLLLSIPARIKCKKCKHVEILNGP